MASLLSTWGINLSSPNVCLLSVIIICAIWPFLTKIHQFFHKKRQMKHILPSNCHLSTIVAEDCPRAWKPGYNWNTFDIVLMESWFSWIYIYIYIRRENIVVGWFCISLFFVIQWPGHAYVETSLYTIIKFLSQENIGRYLIQDTQQKLQQFLFSRWVSRMPQPLLRDLKLFLKLSMICFI